MGKKIGAIILLLIATICLPGITHIVNAEEPTDGNYETDGGTYRPDLLPLDIGFQQWFDGWNACSTVKNQGNIATATPFRSLFEIDGEPLAVAWRYLPVGVGDSITLWSGKFSLSGEHFLSITVDDWNLVTESNEDNNYYGSTFDFD